MYKHPDWVPIAYAIDDVDRFDAFFWGIGKHEANVIDPQRRVLTAVKLAVLPLSRNNELNRLESHHILDHPSSSHQRISCKLSNRIRQEEQFGSSGEPIAAASIYEASWFGLR